MGKRTSHLTGLSRFALEALKETSTDIKSTQENGDGPPTKRRRTDGVRAEGPKYEAYGLVPQYKDASQVPEHLQKYFSQRKRYFSLYDEGCLLDEEGWYSVTPELVADQIAERCRCDTILDAFCGVGGNAIAFAKTCERVIALDIDPTRLALARHNATIYGVADRIEFIQTDYITFANSYLSLPPSSTRKIDIIFLSPPWGGPSYLAGSTNDAAAASIQQGDEVVLPIEAHPEYSLASIHPIHGAELFRLSRRITGNIAYFLPRNTKLEEISALIPIESTNGKGKGNGAEPSEMVEIEEEWMGSKLKALTCYFGGLAGGQEHLY